MASLFILTYISNVFLEGIFSNQITVFITCTQIYVLTGAIQIIKINQYTEATCLFSVFVRDEYHSYKRTNYIIIYFLRGVIVSV